MKIKLMMTCLLTLLLSVVGCQKQVDIKEENEISIESNTKVTFVDDLGREVTVDRPQRVVTLISSFADIWSLAGGVDQIVATTDATWRYFDLPLGKDVVNLGSSKELNLEQLIACEPDLILASCGTDQNLEMEAALTEMGLSVAYFSVNNFTDYLRMLKTCTQITGNVDNYEQYGVTVEQQVKAALSRVDNSEPSVIYIRATGSSCKVKNSQDSVLGEMLLDLGCKNIADQEESLLEQLSMEVIMEKDPDHIFVVLQSADPKEAEMILETTLLSNPAWQSLSAVKNGNYHVMDSNLYNMKPDARWGEAYEGLADMLYPKN